MVERSAQELRQKRRILSRSSFGIPTLDDDKCQASTDFDCGPVTRSKTKVKRSVKSAVPSSDSGRRDYGPPTPRDSQGRDLFTRPSDGKLVYLQCCVAGCGRSQFPNALALRKHVCSPAGLHKIKGLLMTNSQAIEVCGQVVSDPEELSVAAKDQPPSTAHVANVTRAGVLPSPSTNIDGYYLQNNTSPRSLSEVETRSGGTLSKALEPLKAQNLGRGCRMRRSRDGSQTESRVRSEEAADAFSGFTSSDSEDSDESEAEPLKVPADRVDQHKAAKRDTNPPNGVRATATSVGNKAKTAGDNSASVALAVVLAVDDPPIKRERSTSPSPLLELSEHHPSPKTLVVTLEAEQVPSSGTIANRRDRVDCDDTQES